VIDHIGLQVRDVARETEFYLKALAPLGIGIVMQVSAEETGHGAAVGFGAGLKPFFWIGESEAPSGPLHVAFAAESRPPSMRSIMPRFRRVVPTMGRPASGPNITPIITAPSCSI
jgi:catechol 2,3-dioxygenase-like lactoylglutathione lyase family enzyme